jgi:hypothetical protein
VGLVVDHKLACARWLLAAAGGLKSAASEVGRCVGMRSALKVLYKSTIYNANTYFGSIESTVVVSLAVHLLGEATSVVTQTVGEGH